MNKGEVLLLNAAIFGGEIALHVYGSNWWFNAVNIAVISFYLLLWFMVKCWGMDK